MRKFWKYILSSANVYGPYNLYHSIELGSTNINNFALVSPKLIRKSSNSSLYESYFIYEFIVFKATV